MAMAVATIITKVIQVVDAGLNVGVVCMDEEATGWDKAHAAAQGVFGLVQIADVGVQIAGSRISPNYRVGTSIAAATTDITRTGLHVAATAKKHNLSGMEIAALTTQAAGALVFRAGDVAGAIKATSDCPIHIGRCETVENVSGMAGIILSIGASGIRLYMTVPIACRAVSRYLETRRRLIAQGAARMQQLAQNGVGVGTVPTSSVQTVILNPANAAMDDPFATDSLAKADASERYNVVQNLMLNKDQIDRITTISEILVPPTHFWPARCRITNKPIRFVVLPKAINGVGRERGSLTYERGELDKLIASASTVPHWPAAIPLSQASYETAEDSEVVFTKQDMIDIQLGKLIGELEGEVAREALRAAQQQNVPRAAAATAAQAGPSNADCLFVPAGAAAAPARAV